MKKELRDKWLAALRSGEYKQGEGQLVKRGISPGIVRYCCMGVLREVCDLSEFEYSKTAFTIVQLEEVGLPYSMQETLISKNDGTCGCTKHSFSQIANWIEKHVPITTEEDL